MLTIVLAASLAAPQLKDTPKIREGDRLVSGQGHTVRVVTVHTDGTVDLTGTGMYEGIDFPVDTVNTWKRSE